MSLRGAPCRLSIYRNALIGRKNSFVAAAVSYHRHHRSRANHSHTSHTSHGQPKRSSIRPITVLALCIPLGYGLRWALKSADGEEGDGFVKYTLAKKEDISSTCSIFTLRPTDSSAVLHTVAAPKRVITSVQFKQPQLQIARFYTLLPPTQEQDQREVRFLIRKERNGEVSGYLHRLPVGSEIELRGMSVEYTLPEQVDQVIFLAGGTGISPAMQVAAVVAGEADVHILWASRRREDCVGGESDTDGTKTSLRTLDGLKQVLGFQAQAPQDKPAAHEQGTVVTQLEALKQKQPSATPSIPREDKRLTIDYYVDEEGTFIQRGDIARHIAAHGPESESRSGKKLIFVAGPDGFINHWAAGKTWVDGRELQGPLGGVLSQMDLHGWEVVKL